MKTATSSAAALVALCLLALCLAGVAGGLVFAAVPGPERNPVKLPEVFPQPCGLRPECATTNAPAVAAAQSPLNF